MPQIREAIQGAFRGHLKQYHHHEHDLGTPVRETRKLSPRLTDRPKKIRMIKELWIAVERNRREISRKTGIHEDQVSRWIKAALESGELHY